MPMPLFNKNLDIKLLKLVKEYPILYNATHSSYLNFDAREVVWQKIGDILNRPAVEFAGIQCQIHFDDFHEEKHKPGYIENLSEFLPESYASSWGVEKKILKAYRTHNGLNQLDAKCLYIKTARDLPTYGVTFFLVKEKQKNKKKLVPRLLGINAESILRLDENTKEILQVWPLTQVKTYHVGKSETFTLNFGDYSDKEYSVKTRDAYRIRDILEGYIDLIRKRLLAGRENVGSDGAVIFHDNVESSRGNVIQVVPNNPSKVVEQSFIGPSKLIPYANETKSGEGTQIVTMQQMVVTGMVNNPHQAMKGEVPMRSDMGMESIRRLNRLNSQSVVLVGLLSEPDEGKIREAQRMVDTINTDIMPVLIEGLNKSAQKQSTEEGKKKMLDEIKELSEYVQKLTESMKIDCVKPKEAEETAMNIANLTAQMYAELDPRTKRRSDLLRKSRRSFIVDEKMDSSLRRASFIAAATTALHVVDDTQKNIYQPYQGPPLDKTQIEDTEKSALDKLGKLNAAIALYLTAHSDPKITDYSTAVTSMNTIKELMPELAADAQALGSVKDSKSRQQLLDGIRSLCEATRTICSYTGAEDHEKMQDASNKFADVSRKLMFTIGKGVDKAKEAEIIKLAKTALDKAVLLQKAGNELPVKSKSPEAKEIQDAGNHVVNCAKDLLACAKLAGTCPHEAHGRSALVAAAAGAGAAARGLLRAAASPASDKLHARAAELDKALEAINEACSQIDDADAKAVHATSPGEMLRLQIVKTITVAQDTLHAADDDLNKPLTSTILSTEDGEKLKLQLAKKIAQINAAMASFVAANSDRKNPDRETAELAIRTITELVPEVTRDAKNLSESMDPDSRNQFLRQIQALCQATKDVCATGNNGQGCNDAVMKFSNASENLVFTLSPKEDATKGQQMLDLAGSACDKASQLLSNVHQMAEKVGGVYGEDLDSKGVMMADKAQGLLAAAQVTAPTISEARCQTSLLSMVDGLSSSSQSLADSWRQVPSSPYYHAPERELQELEKILEKMRKACQFTPPGVGAAKVMIPMVSPQEVQRLKFVKTVSRAKKNLQAADDELNKPDICLLMRQDDADQMNKELQQRIEDLNAAVAALLVASQDRSNPDYVAIEEAVGSISNLLPLVAKDSKTLSASMDSESRDKLLAKVRALCDASKDICSSAESGKGLETAASKFADASGRLVFTISPKSATSNEQQVIDFSNAACDKTAQLLFNVQQLSQQVGGVAGEDLDRKGIAAANNAQAILVASQNWGPNISDPVAQSELLSAVDILSSSSQELAQIWRQLPKGPRLQAMERELQELEKILGQLRGTCESAADDAVKKTAEVKRLQFVKSAARARRNLQAADNELNKPILSALLSQEDVVNTQHRLHQHIADLNTAIAALLASTSGPTRQDYAAAEKSIDTIIKLLPEVVKDAKDLGAGQEPSSRDALMKQVRALCDASKEICASAETGQGLSESASKFADASGRLVFTISPYTNKTKKQQVLELSAAACGTASQLLSNVQQLSQQVGGDAGEDLDRKGAKAADNAKELLDMTQESAPAISDPEVQKSLLSTVDALSSSTQELAATWRQVPAGPRNQTLERELQELEKILGQLRGVCAGDEAKKTAEVKRMQFVKSAAGARRNLQAADDALNEPLSPAPLSQEKVVNKRNRLHEHMAALSAAIAALLASTADRSRSDYAAAENSVETISKLVPEVVRDAKSLSSAQEASARETLMKHVRALCNAGKDVCAGAETGQGLSESASKFADASGKLMFVISPNTSTSKEQQVLDLSTAACGTASQLLSNVQQLSQQVGGDAGEDLDRKGAKAADAAKALLAAVKKSAPTISEPASQKSVLAAVDDLLKLSQDLGKTWRQMPAVPQHETLERELHELEKTLAHLREACRSAGDQDEMQRIKFVKTVALTKENLKTADEELKKPAPTTPLTQEAAVDMQHQLQQELGQMSGAVAALITSTADRSHPDYATAEQSLGVVTLLLPLIINDAKTLTPNQEPAGRDALLERIHALCDATKQVCARVETGKELPEAASKYANASGKLVYVINPRVDVGKGQKVLDLSAVACGTASQLLTNVQQLSQQLGGDAGEDLDRKGATVADKAQALLTVAQVTVPSITDPHCQASMLSSVDALSASSQHLAEAWRKLPSGAQKPLEHELQELEKILAQIKAACKSDAGSKCKVRPEVAPPPRARVPPPAPPRRHSRASIHLTKEFLDGMRHDEEQAAGGFKLLPSMPNADEKYRQQFLKAVEDASKTIGCAENDLKELCKSPSHAAGPKLSANQQAKKQKEMEDKLALANVEVAALVGANYADTIDYNNASKSIIELPQLLSSIVEDGKSISTSFTDKARQAFLHDMLQYCEKTKALCDTAKNDRQKLKEAAVNFGDKSAKILYTVSSEADHDLEKQIISTAKDIGDSTSRLAQTAQSAQSAHPPHPPRLAATLDSAGALLYTAKLVAPTIHNPTCKEALLESAYKMSENLKNFSDTWKPLTSDPQHAKSVKELTEESEKLVQLLEHLNRCTRGQQAVEEGKKLVVENSPLRVLACKIHQDAQKKSEDPQLSVTLRHEYAQYCDAVRRAVGLVDDAGLQAARSPADINKHRELENAIQNLQMVIFQNRPNRDGKAGDNRIVDLREYIEDVATEADQMIETANQLETKRGNRALEEIKEECQEIKSGATSSLGPQQYYRDDSVDDDFEIDTFAKDCESRIASIGSQMRALEDEKAHASLLPRYDALVVTCNVLRFATRSGLAAAQSASLDAALETLHHLDNKLARVMEDQNDDVVVRRVGAAVPPKPWCRWRAMQAVQSLQAVQAVQSMQSVQPLQALGAYVSHELLRAQDQPEQKHRLQKHLSKLIHLMKLMTVVTSKRVATWQPLNHPELTTISDQILQEFEKPESGYGSSEHGQSMLTPEDIKELLSPNQNVKIVGDEKQLQERIQKSSGKLSAMSGSVVQSCGGGGAGCAGGAGGAARSAHAAAGAATELAHAARARARQDPVHSKRIEEAAQEMLFATYNLLAMSEYVSQKPDHPSSRLKLLEALRQLNYSINKLTRVTCPDNKQQHCEELCRSLQLQQSILQGAPRPSCTVVYKDCVDALNSQQDVIEKLKIDVPMSRRQFLDELSYATSAVCNSSDYAVQCAYLISISDENKIAAKESLLDIHKIHKWLATVEDSCVTLMHSGNVEKMEDESRNLMRQVESLSELLKNSISKVEDHNLKRQITESTDKVIRSADAVCRAIEAVGGRGLCVEGEDKIWKLAMELLSAVNETEAAVDNPSLQPQVASIHPDTRVRSEEILNNSRALITNTQALVKQVNSSPDDDEMTWVTFKMGRDQVLDSFDALLKCIRLNGNRCGVLEYSIDVADEDAETANKSYVQVQLDTANQWLRRSSCSAVTKLAGQQAAKNIVDIGKKMVEDMKPAEKETTQHLITEIEQLQSQCSVKYEKEKYSLLMERLKELKKIIERDLVTRVVEELIEEEAPLEDLELITDLEKDESKRHYLLEKKIAELLAQLGRMTKTARFVADAGNGTPAVSNELKKSSDQSELLAPMLVKAAQERINKPNDKAVVENYKILLAKYADSLSRVRELCDQAVDPMDFVQTAGVMMERMREESSQHNDPKTCAKTSNVITKLAHRVISVSMSSRSARRDPELQRALLDARQRLRAAIPAAGTRASRLPDWRHTTAEILRTTGEVESVLGGENIFNKQPEPNQPIYSVALDLHASVREWSSRDNEIVAVARRMAVLMARLSDYMNTDKQRELLLTSKQIVQESHEVAYLAKKMAHECTDVRIKTNLLLACERIPTISTQLKMLTTVKGSSLGHQGTKEDMEAMNMLVENAQSLMRSIQDVVKGAASASVKIMSQHGPRNRWVRRNYY